VNEQIFQFFYGFAHQSNFIDRAIVFLAVYFPWLVAVLAIIFIFYYYGIFYSPDPTRTCIEKWKEIVFPFFAGISAWIVGYVIKFLIHAHRPFEILSNVSPLMAKDGYSFPSGHTVLFSALAFAIFFLNKKAGYVFILFAILIGLARIVSGVHFPVDILGGFLLGFVVSFFFDKFFKKL